MKLLFMRWAVIVNLLAAGATAARGDIPQVDRKQDTLQAVLDRIHEHAANENWKQGGFTDEAIEKWLDKVVASVARAANFPDLKVPVRLAEVKPSSPANQIAVGRVGVSVKGGLIIAKNADLKTARLQDSIVLADGAVDIDSARGSVIIARGPVAVRSMSSHSIIVSGIYVRIADFDGEPRNAINGSLIISRSRAEVGTPYGSLIVAPGGAAVTRVSTRSEPVFINTAAPQSPRAGLGAAMFGQAAPPAPPVGKTVKAPDLPLESVPKHPLAQKIELLGVIKREAAPRPGVIPPVRDTEWTAIVFRFDGRRYIADLGEPIVNEAGDPVLSLEGWRLTFATDKFAVLSSDRSDALIEMAAQ